MTLAYGIGSPRDMLAKAKRDLERLETAEGVGDSVAIGDVVWLCIVANQLVTITATGTPAPNGSSKETDIVR